MERGNYFIKKSVSGPFTKMLLRFVSTNFDWLALVFITLIILLALVLF